MTASNVIKMEISSSPEPPESTTKLMMDDNPVYHQRKCMISEYKELFSALFRLPDKEIQKKVLSCINAKYRSVATQTNRVEIIEIIPTAPKTEITRSKDEECRNVKIEKQTTSPADTCSESAEPESVLPKKRKRKRKVILPQANKVSRVAVAKKQQLAKLSNAPLDPLKHLLRDLNGTYSGNDFGSKRIRTESLDFSDTSSYINAVIDDIPREETRSADHLCQSLVKDFLLAEYPLENGLLPIQDSVIKSQVVRLSRHLFIWKDYKKTDLNEILTEDGEDLLQLGIEHNCLPGTAKLLLDKGLNSCSLDERGNTIVHLAVIHDVDKHLLKQLMECMDLKMLLTFNDDGYTSLHLAVRQDCYLLAECILDTLDERLSGKRFHKRIDDIFETDEEERKKHFQEYYENFCLGMEIDDDTASVTTINNHEQKQQLLQAVDMRTGNTALFFAIENQTEHLVYFLLAHLIDPRTENFSGQNCKSFFSEYCKTLKLSLNIDSAMEKVIRLLS